MRNRSRRSFLHILHGETGRKSGAGYSKGSRVMVGSEVTTTVILEYRDLRLTTAAANGGARSM